MPDQAPNINVTPGAGRLVYDKARRTIVKQQPPISHPGGWKHHSTLTFPRLYEAWLVLTGKWSLHRAWQRGYDQHIQDDSLRRSRGGR